MMKSLMLMLMHAYWPVIVIVLAVTIGPRTPHSALQR
jgi:hypothetical protein